MHDCPEVSGHENEGSGAFTSDDAAEAGTLASLVDRACSLDAPVLVRQEAFSALVERYQDLAFGYAYALLGDPHLAQDATQEAFLTAYRHLHTLRAPAAFLSWLRRIVRTQCVRLRRSKEPVTVPLDSPAAEDVLETRPHAVRSAVAAHTPPSDPATIVEERELQASIARLVQTLPPREREVTLLFYLGGYAQQEIAQFLDVPVNTVKKRMQAARQRLQERMLIMADDALRDHGREYLPSRDDRFIETVRFLTTFEAAASEGELPMVELLLVDGVDVNARDVDGRTLLSWAAQRGQIDATELLLQHGADVNARDRGGTTPLGWAERGGHRAVAALLRRRGGVR